MFGNVFNGKKVLITGNTGFKGSWLSVWLLTLGAEVIGVSNDIPTKPSLFQALGLDKKIKYIQADVRDLTSIVNIVASEKPHFLFHLAAQPIVAQSYANPIATFTTNVIGTTAVLEALRVSNHECYAVFITTDKCYENLGELYSYKENDRLGGKDPYSASKASSELAINAWFHSYFKLPSSNVKITVARSGNVIGGGDWGYARLVPDCVRAWSLEQSVEIRNPQAIRPWQHVLEPLSGYLRCAQVLASQPSALSGEAFNFGPAPESSYTVLQLIEALHKHWEFTNVANRINLNQSASFQESNFLLLNSQKALELLQWKPLLSFEEAVRYTAIWYSEYYKGSTNMYAITEAQLEEYKQLTSQQKMNWAS